MTTKHVYLGRFAPFHMGHERLLRRMIEMFGEGNVLILVGSSNALNSRTPYTYEARKEIIKTVFANVEVLPLPDGKPNLVYFDGSTNNIWLDSITKLAAKRDEEFVFYGGSKNDLEVLAERFKTVVLVDRFGDSEGLSATKIRELVEIGNATQLEKYVNKKTVELIISRYQKL